jgi:Rod binding domain-containing protein
MTAVSGASGLLGPALAPAPKPAEGSPRVAAAAQKFDALLIGQLLKSMHESDDGGWTGTDSDDAGAPAMELADEQLAQAMASHGGFGLAHLVAAGLNTKTPAGDGQPPEAHPVQP